MRNIAYILVLLNMVVGKKPEGILMSKQGISTMTRNKKAFLHLPGDQTKGLGKNVFKDIVIAIRD